jgi:hypothetical protein
LQIEPGSEIVFQFVPVRRAADAIAAFPNGYFEGDLSPMQNHMLAYHLETEYGLELFGVGSRFLGFRRAEALDAAAAHAVATTLVALYRGPIDGASESLAKLLTGRDWLLFRYTES